MSDSPNPESFDEEMHPVHPLAALIHRINGGGGNTKTKDIGVLTAEETALFNEMKATAKEAERLHHKSECLKKHFWSTLKRNRDLFDKSLHIDEKTGMLSMDVEED